MPKQVVSLSRYVTCRSQISGNKQTTHAHIYEPHVSALGTHPKVAFIPTIFLFSLLFLVLHLSFSFVPHLLITPINSLTPRHPFFLHPSLLHPQCSPNSMPSQHIYISQSISKAIQVRITGLTNPYMTISLLYPSEGNLRRILLLAPPKMTTLPRQ